MKNEAFEFKGASCSYGTANKMEAGNISSTNTMIRADDTNINRSR